jgi:hypothetical protein
MNFSEVVFYSTLYYLTLLNQVVIQIVFSVASVVHQQPTQLQQTPWYVHSSPTTSDQGINNVDFRSFVYHRNILEVMVILFTL